MNAATPIRAGASCVDTRLSVPGIRCAACIAKIESGLSRHADVVATRVDVSAKQVRVTHAPTLAVPDLIAAMAQLGFDAHALASLGERTGDDEQRQLLSALGVAAFAAMNIMLLSVAVWSGASGGERALFHWLSAAIAIPAVAWAGRPFFRSAWQAVSRGRTNMDVPVSIGVLLATAMSLYETATGGPHAWFDGVVMLLLFLLTGRVLDGMMRHRARSGALALAQATAPGAQVQMPDGCFMWRDVGDIAPGDVMLVAAGERIAADAVLLSDHCRVDQSILTGEAAPVALAAGASLLAGMLNIDGPVLVRAVAVGEDRVIAALARAMEDAGQHRSTYVRIAERAARLYAPAVHTLALATLVGWLLAGAGWHQALLIAIAVLIITCPCALGLAVPVAQVVASGALMRAGILVKDGSALERLATVDRALLDKTGTLTLGQMQPIGLDALSAADASVALALTQGSSHPVSRAIAAALRERGCPVAVLDAIVERPGEGMFAMHHGVPVSISRGDAGVMLSTGRGEPVAIAMADRLRPDTDAAVSRLRAIGIDPMILSGDGHDAVAAVARDLNIAGVSRARPEEKLAHIARMAARGDHVLMVGDGLNDGPALAAAHASMAPSSASDVGQQAADLVFTGQSLNAVPIAVVAARRTQQVVRQNMALAVGYNLIAVPIAMAGLATPLVAAVAMSLSSLLVVGNSLRLVGAAR